MPLALVPAAQLLPSDGAAIQQHGRHRSTYVGTEYFPLSPLNNSASAGG